MAKTMHSDVPGFTPETVNLAADLAAQPEPEGEWTLDGLTVKVQRGRDALWVVARRPGHGGIALRTFPILGRYDISKATVTETGGEWHIDTNSATCRVRLIRLGPALLRMTTWLTPKAPLLVVFWPRDLYPLDAEDDPRGVQGQVEAAQRGLNGGWCYLVADEPAFGSVLYMQNLTALNPFFVATKSKPDGVIGGRWPELGYLPPAAPLGPSPPDHPLHAGEEVAISDVLLAFGDAADPDEAESARFFIDSLAAIYPHLDKPLPEFRDWPARAGQTLRDLKTAEAARQVHDGHVYLRPYLDAEYPDCMVQMTVLRALREYDRFRGEVDGLGDELAAGMRGFHDAELRTLRRYLPDVGDDKDRDAVDSWYLYHPLMNLARLAIDGEAWARDLFFDSLDRAIEAARHFAYKWPILFNIRDFSVIEQSRGEDNLGQTDVGGLYAYVMLQAHQLSDDPVYLDEARKALDALKGRGFELAYQTNLTAWGAVACLKLAQADKDPARLRQSQVFVASFLHNCELWGSHIEFADAYANFFGVTCLHDGPYMAAYEAFECFMAFDEYLRLAGGDASLAVRHLLSEYWRYALDVLWSFYPDALPEGAISDKVRNGRIDRNLSFPLEDIYGDGSPAGQVGQEIYGAGAAFVAASRAWHRHAETPLSIFAECPATVDWGDRRAEVSLHGSGACQVRIRLLADALPHGLRVSGPDGEPVADSGDGITYAVPGDGHIVIVW